MSRFMRKITLPAMAVFAALLLWALAAPAASGYNVRLKDVAKFQGVRDNQLVGFGIVVGLNGTGDGVLMTRIAVKNMLDKLGISMNIGDVNVDNIAAVIVTANLPAFLKPGDKVDVNVSSVGDADSIRGGTLVQTPLKGADGQIYAVAQGPVSIGGYTAGNAGASRAKGFPTSGRIPGGASVEREVPTELMNADKAVYINLNNADFSMAAEVQDKINENCMNTWVEKWGACGSSADNQRKTCTNCTCCSAVAVDASTIKVTAPGVTKNSLVSFFADLEPIELTQIETAKVVISEKTGTIVIGDGVFVDACDIAHGSLSVKVDPGVNVSQPKPLSGGKTVKVKNPNIKVEEPVVALTRVSAGDIVKALNDMGVTPSDIIAIIQDLKAAGCLQAEVVVQ